MSRGSLTLVLIAFPPPVFDRIPPHHCSTRGHQPRSSPSIHFDFSPFLFVLRLDPPRFPERALISRQICSPPSVHSPSTQKFLPQIPFPMVVPFSVFPLHQSCLRLTRFIIDICLFFRRALFFFFLPSAHVFSDSVRCPSAIAKCQRPALCKARSVFQRSMLRRSIIAVLPKAFSFPPVFFFRLSGGRLVVDFSLPSPFFQENHLAFPPLTLHVKRTSVFMDLENPCTPSPKPSLRTSFPAFPYEHPPFPLGFLIDPDFSLKILLTFSYAFGLGQRRFNGLLRSLHFSVG